MDFGDLVEFAKLLKELGVKELFSIDRIIQGGGNTEPRGIQEDIQEEGEWESITVTARDQCILGLAYIRGEASAARNVSRGWKWLEASACAGYAPAQFYVGAEYLFGMLGCVDLDSVKAVHWIQKAADQEYVEAQGLLGKMYGSGTNVEKDYERSEYWIMRAAKQGQGEALFVLGGMHYNGLGSRDKDLTLAMHWWKRAAEKDHGAAQFNLGLLYALMDNCIEAWAWLSIAKDNKDKRAQHAHVAQEGVGNMLTQNQMRSAQERARILKAALRQSE